VVANLSVSTMDVRPPGSASQRANPGRLPRLGHGYPYRKQRYAKALRMNTRVTPSSVSRAYST